MILIDAAHSEERRVAALNDDGLVTSFDFEISSRPQIKGNIYLAKIKRIEPSLRAVFIEYSEGKSGFLPFSDVHPFYYNISEQEKMQLMEKHADWLRSKTFNPEYDGTEISSFSHHDAGIHGKQYAVHKVLKEKQMLLVQATKEERGNKSPSFSTYVSLTGRHSIFLPNTPGKDGVSRLITQEQHRDKLSTILETIAKPKGSSLVIRKEATLSKKENIARDVSVIMHLWKNIKERAKKVSVPSLIHSDGNMIKRSLRDLCCRSTRDIVIDCNDRLWEEFSNYCSKVFSGSDENNVRIKRHKDKTPIFVYYKAEEQLFNLYNRNCPLRSGGYLIIDSTEAMIAIDVNSGTMTNKTNVELTALQTNREAALEVARQIRLRNLSGIIVIDFIDMEESKNRKEIENLMKNAFQDDHCRTQFSNISQFGLMEMSRQRIKPSFIELYATTCSSCAGAGSVRSTEATVSSLLRALQSDIRSSSTKSFRVHANQDVIEYISNHCRNTIRDIERRNEVTVLVSIDGTLVRGQFRIVMCESTNNKTSTIPSADWVAQDSRNSRSAEAKTQKKYKRNSRSSDRDRNNFKPKEKKNISYNGNNNRRNTGDQHYTSWIKRFIPSMWSK